MEVDQGLLQKSFESEKKLADLFKNMYHNIKANEQRETVQAETQTDGYEISPEIEFFDGLV